MRSVILIISKQITVGYRALPRKSFNTINHIDGEKNKNIDTEFSGLFEASRSN